MGPYDRPPMADYVFKMMLLEAIKLYKEGNGDAIHWLEGMMFKMVSRWEELEKRGK
jgi:hypothetical protein